MEKKEKDKPTCIVKEIHIKWVVGLSEKKCNKRKRKNCNILLKLK